MSQIDLISRVEPSFHRISDWLFSRLPQPVPARERLEDCKIVAHRGTFDGRHVRENTLPAFRNAWHEGAWGIEFDIRWTRDHVPVVLHDADLLRVFHAPDRVIDLMFSELRLRFPMVPSLEEVVTIWGKRLHLMIEIKMERFAEPQLYKRRLADLLSVLEPCRDYHLLSLDPPVFDIFDFAPPTALLPVARLETRRFSRLAIEKGYGGVTGHYLFIADRRIRSHHGHHQRVGTGFIASRNCLFRELNRGVDWIFSHHVAQLQRHCRIALDRSRLG